MEEQPFKPGDVVELQSGGPKMTVEEYDETLGIVRCMYAEQRASGSVLSFGAGKPYWSGYISQEFPAVMLRKLNVVTVSNRDGRSVFGEAAEGATDGRI